MKLQLLAYTLVVCRVTEWAHIGPAAFDHRVSETLLDGLVPKAGGFVAAKLAKASETGVPIGYKDLGVAIGPGQGVAKDQERAMAILKQACNGGDRDACRAIERSVMRTNESAVLGRLVAYMSAEAAYLHVNRGYYAASLLCLVTPTTEGCLGSAGPSSPFIAADTVSDEPAFGYRFHFQAVPAPRRAIIAGASRQSATAFLVWAVPVEVGRTGQRGFMMDSTGLICTSPDGSVPTADLTRQSPSQVPAASCWSRLHQVRRADAAAVPRGAPLELRGAEAVAKGALAGSRRAGSAPVALALIDGNVGVVVAPRGRPRMAVAFEVRGGRIATLDIIADPER